MDQLTWLQQSLQKPRLSALARTLAEVFPRSSVPRVALGPQDTSRGTYNSASKLAPDHLEYPGFILRYREMNAGGNYVNHGWARPRVDHIGVLGGQVTVANDGFFSGIVWREDDLNPWNIYTETPDSRFSFTVRPRVNPTIARESLSGFTSLVPSLPGLLTNEGETALLDSDGTILLTDALAFEEPISRGFTSIQWLTEFETRRA
jgi:hypothetical protein|nr:MAG TPA: hypothetical protein [Caudoviricetes sp.]